VKKLAIIDLLFNWPPDGGARIDVKEIASRLGRDMSVCLFVPDFTSLCRRGDVRQKLDFEVRSVSFDQYSFNFLNVSRVFRKEMQRFQPDHVFLADGWFLKPYLCIALADFAPVLRFYAYETLCLRSHGLLFVDDHLCPVDYLNGPGKVVRQCIRCGQELFNYRLAHHYGQEFYAALAHTRGYRQTVIRALQSVRSIICYNEFIRERLQRFHDDVRIIPSGVDSSLFRPLKTNGPAYGSHNPAGDKKIIFMPGRADDPVKGFPVLQKAAELLRKKRQDFEIWFTALSTVMVKEDYIRNIGWADHQRMPEIYQQARFCVIPSVWPEPFGIITLEAMACEKPVIVFESGNKAGIIEQDKTGFIVPDGDIEGLASRMDDLLSCQKRVETMGQAGRQVVVDTYSWDTIIRRHYHPLFN